MKATWWQCIDRKACQLYKAGVTLVPLGASSLPRYSSPSPGRVWGLAPGTRAWRRPASRVVDAHRRLRYSGSDVRRRHLRIRDEPVDLLGVLLVRTFSSPDRAGRRGKG
jgi:hypothetical protein